EEADAEEPADDGAEEADGEEAADDEEAAAHLGVPVGARDDVVLLDDGAGLLQARDLSDGAALLWSVSGDSVAAEDGRPLSAPRPRLLGFYPLPEEEGGSPADDAESEESAEPRRKIGRASCRERVEIGAGAASVIKQNRHTQPTPIFIS